MLSKKNYKERLRKMEAKKERFSIRKFSVGAASVLIGFFLAGIGSQSAHAATTNDPAATEKVETASSAAANSEAPASSSAASSATSASEKASSAASSANSVATSSAASSASVKSEAPASSAAVKSDAKVATSSAASSAAVNNELKSLADKGAKVGKNAQGTYAMLDATEATDSEASASSAAQNDAPIEADAIKDGYIKAGIDMTNAKSTLSGKAYTRNRGGAITSSDSVTGGALGSSQKAVEDGQKVYMKWQDTDGAISPTYYTTVHALSTNTADQAGPGAYAFDLRQGFTVAGDYEKDGKTLKKHVYTAAPGQYFTLWMEPYTDEDGITWEPLRQIPGNTMGSWVNSTIPAKYLNGAFQLAGTNMQRTAVFLGDPSNTEWMTKPRDEWKESSVKEWQPVSPGVVGVLGNDTKTTNSISGRIWLNTNPNITAWQTQSAMYDASKDFAYKKGDDVIVYASALTPEGMAAYKSQVQSLDDKEQPAATKKLLEAHPEYIAETVYGHILDDEGHYDLKFSDDVNLKNVENGVYVGAIINGQPAAAWSTYATPVFGNPKGNWAAQVAAATPVDGMGGVITGIKDSWNNVGLAVTPNAKVNMNIVNYNLTTSPAPVGTTVPAVVKMNTQMPELPIGQNQVQWYQNGKAIGKPIEVTLATVNNDGIANLTIPADAKDGDIFTAKYTSNGTLLSQASFVVHDSEATLNEPNYADSTVKQGNQINIPVTFTDRDGNKVDTPEGVHFGIPNNTKFPDGVTATVNPDNGTISVTAAQGAALGEFDIPVQVNYEDGSNDLATAHVTVTPNDANEYNPAYKTVNVKQGESVETGAPTYTDKDGKTVTAPAGTKYEISGNPTFPEGVTAKVDPATGNVTVTTSSNTPEGPVIVPVKVTYPDGSTETVDAPIAVGPNTFIGTNYSFMVTGSLKNLHETTQNSMYVDPAKTITKIVWWNNKDLVNSELTGKGAVQHEITDFTGMTAEWINPLNTNVDTASLEEVVNSPKIKLTFGDNSQLIKETGTNLFATSDHSMSISWDTKMEGATPVADAASKKTEVTPAKAGDKLTDAEMALINTTNLDKLTANKPVSYTWAKDLKAGDTQGTVRITFQDKDKNGQPTYLDVELPAGSLNVVNPKTDADKYTPEGQDVHTNVGGTPEASEGIANIPSLPSGTKYTWKDGEPDTKTPGTKPATVVVTYPDGSQDEVPVKVIVEQPSTHYSENATGTPIVTPKGVMPNPADGIGNKDELDPKTTYTWTNGEPDVNKIGKTTVSITVHYPDGKTQVVDTPLIVTGTEKPGDPGITNPDDPAYSDLFKTVTRTIKTDTKNADGITTEGPNVQKVVFGRSKTVDKDGNTTYGPYTVYNTTTNKLTNDKTGTFTKVDVPQHDGYVSQVNGENATEVPEVTGVTAETADSTVTITYVKADSDAAKYTPEGQPVNTKQGVVPDASEGIKNKTDLPEGTKYTWKDTPDVTTSGSHPAVVVVTYPDGSQDEVPVTVNVPAPEGQNVNTDKGVVPNPSQGIKNPEDMPEGTKYTWKDTPDVSTVGEHPAVVVVTYPDGKTEEVPVKVVVTDNTPVAPTPTQADQYTPEGQDVPTVIGTVPNPADGIKNKTDLPGGTTYTWKDTPDVNTAGSHDAVIIVTYPDGSQDEVPVKVVVTAPEGQDVHTPQGVVPNPEDAIKNKDDMPSGTKYTWKDTPEVNTPGSHPAVVIVTLPNGKTVEVPVTVVVDNPTPEGQDIHTPQGVLPDPSEGIKNKDDMPSGTKYEWEKKPDVKTPGKHEGTIRVIFPNGETVDVPVTVVVAPKSNRDDIAGVHSGDNENGNNNGGNGNGSEVVAGVKGTHEANLTGNNGNNNNANAAKNYMDSRSKTLPQTGANDGAAAMLGLMIASVGAILGLAVEKKRRN